MRSIYKMTAVVVLLILILAGCSNDEVVPTDSGDDQMINREGEASSEGDVVAQSEVANDVVTEIENSETSEGSETNPAETKDADLTTEVIEASTPEIDYLTVKPDESKEIMVIMYHNLSDKNSAYGRTVESFKGDLQRLYDMGFRTISMQDYIQNNIETEAGYTPVVLTFDDGHPTNFNYLEKGSELVIDPDCVVGIMDAFSETHPGFGRNAIFYLNYGNAFGQPDYLEQKISYLLENGYEIGNHAFSHEDLSTLNADGIQTALGKNALLYHEIDPLITMDSLALPFGKRPEDKKLRAYIESGEYEGYGYENKAILAVGWKPYYPVYHVKYDYKYVNRVQSGDGEMQLTWWLDNYVKSPSNRFISDGDPSRISVPAENNDQIDADKVGDKELYFYELESK